MESISRASLSSIVPIQAYDLLKDKQAVSLLYFVVGIVGIGATLYAPAFYRTIPRRFIYTGGALALIGASAALATNTLAGQAVGMFLRVFGASTLSIVLNLYIMEYIPKHNVVRSESLRLALSTISWSAGPAFGVWLYVSFGPIAPYLWSAVWALILIAIFWFFRLSSSPAISAGPLRPVDPIASIRRFAAQPRMRLAWLIAFGRSCYWSTFFIYAPILMVATGKGELAGGIVVSLGNLCCSSPSAGAGSGAASACAGSWCSPLSPRRQWRSSPVSSAKRIRGAPRSSCSPARFSPWRSTRSAARRSCVPCMSTSGRR